MPARELVTLGTVSVVPSASREVPLNHSTLGGGSPIAEQLKVAVVLRRTAISVGGDTITGGTRVRQEIFLVR